MPHRTRVNCRHCHRHESEVGPISWSGACPDCGHERMDANNLSIHLGYGVGHERRRYGYARRLFGARAALELKRAGVFGSALNEGEIAA